MKNSLKITALSLLLSTGLFATASAKPTDPTTPSVKDVITFSSLPSLRGLDVKVEKSGPGKAVVMVYDQNDNVIFKDALPDKKKMEKGYILDQLENGDYTIEVVSNKQSVKKDIHVYDENNVRTFIVLQQ
jgi:hypothetical protein